MPINIFSSKKATDLGFSWFKGGENIKYKQVFNKDLNEY